MSENIQSDNSPGETMRLAVERFRTRMESANRQFLQDRIDEIEAMHLSTEAEKSFEMSDYLVDLGEPRRIPGMMTLLGILFGNFARWEMSHGFSKIKKI